MLKKPDKDEFTTAINTEVKNIFTNDVWERLTRKEMLDYHAKLRKQGGYVKAKN